MDQIRWAKVLFICGGAVLRICWLASRIVTCIMTAASTLGVHHFASFFYLNPPKWKTFVHTIDQLLHGCCQCLLLYCFQEKLFTLWASSLLLSKSCREKFSKSFRKPSYYTHSSSSCASNMLLWRRPMCADSCTFAWPKHTCMHACMHPWAASYP